MAIDQHFIHLDLYFKTLEGDKVILNDLNFYSINDMDFMKKNIMMIYDNIDTISLKPQCECGRLTGRSLVNEICKVCGTKCLLPEDKVYPVVWLKAITVNTEDNMTIKFLNPAFWAMLSKTIHSKIDYLRYLSDSRSPMKLDQLTPEIVHIRDVILQGNRTYINFVSNIENIILYLSSLSKFKPKRDILDTILNIYRTKQNDLYSTYLPIFNKKMFVIEETKKGRFANIGSSSVLGVAVAWMKMCSDEDVTLKKISNMTGYVVSELSKIGQNYFNQYLVKKTGIFRKHVFGARSHFTFRCVIVSIPGPHQHNGVIVPWIVGVTAFRPHVLNKLSKRGYTLPQAIELINIACKTYVPVISEILDELIEEAPDRQIKLITHRNPSLLQTSAQLVYIAAFKKDPHDYTLGISALIIKGPNGDYDGDELNNILLLDNDLSNEFVTLEPYNALLDVSKPFSISGNMSLLSPATTLVSNWMDSDITSPQDMSYLHSLQDG